MGRLRSQVRVMFCVAIACLGASHVAAGASPRAECHGILHRDHGSIRFGGGPGEGEGICIVVLSEQAKVLKKCSEGVFCRVRGITGPCQDSGECTEIKRVSGVQKH